MGYKRGGRDRQGKAVEERVQVAAGNPRRSKGDACVAPTTFSTLGIKQYYLLSCGELDQGEQDVQGHYTIDDHGAAIPVNHRDGEETEDAILCRLLGCSDGAYTNGAYRERDGGVYDSRDGVHFSAGTRCPGTTSAESMGRLLGTAPGSARTRVSGSPPSTGSTTMGHIQRKHLKEAVTFCPPDEVLMLLGEKVVEAMA